MVACAPPVQGLVDRGKMGRQDGRDPKRQPNDHAGGVDAAEHQERQVPEPRGALAILRHRSAPPLDRVTPGSQLPPTGTTSGPERSTGRASRDRYGYRDGTTRPRRMREGFSLG